MFYKKKFSDRLLGCSVFFCTFATPQRSTQVTEPFQQMITHLGTDRFDVVCKGADSSQRLLHISMVTHIKSTYVYMDLFSKTNLKF
jgi:hypothetical protein